RRSRGRGSVRRGRGIAPAPGRPARTRRPARARAPHPGAPLRLRGRALDARGDRPRARPDSRARPAARGPGSRPALAATRSDLSRGLTAARIGSDLRAAYEPPSIVFEADASYLAAPFRFPSYSRRVRG